MISRLLQKNYKEINPILNEVYDVYETVRMHPKIRECTLNEVALTLKSLAKRNKELIAEPKYYFITKAFQENHLGIHSSDSFLKIQKELTEKDGFESLGFLKKEEARIYFEDCTLEKKLQIFRFSSKN